MKKINVGQFHDDAGNTYDVIERVKQIKKKLMSGETIVRDGSRDFITSCGKDLNCIGKGTFTLLDGTTLRPVE